MQPVEEEMKAAADEGDLVVVVVDEVMMNAAEVVEVAIHMAYLEP